MNEDKEISEIVKYLWSITDMKAIEEYAKELEEANKVRLKLIEEGWIVG
mgnify:CR=1 FL=1